ncbi:DHA2 family efflux MFS transporter permease subunit [Paenibacillus alkaliterrae]|uniref:DHA2 family efflux MFS transporter permease subunit n=1 Tax=Paenibacillus alkaliterrae TaxID=320909 RepID=UPI001F16DC7E|nr:DHA2 family efflux MFS transporter permease subunit [Paenibacillus alkaliterrae]MCF2939954.1 DHA2 family efflux MFS transporter permease subunit [Paenibacillus alkaliterrae]
MSNYKDNNYRTRPILTVLLIGAIAAILNQTVLNVALPTLSEEFDVPTSTSQWLITLYMLVNGVFIPITAFLMARFSTRQLFFAAMIFFSVGTLICGAAPTFALLLAGRVIQAIGAGIVMPLLFSVVFRLFPPEKRGAAMGIVGVAITFAPAVGPTLSGLLITQLSWRYIFFAILPFSLTALVASFFLLKNVSKPQAMKLDILSVMFSTFGFGGILYGFSIAGNLGWGSVPVFLALTIGLITLVLFVLRQLTTDNPLIDLKIFKSIEFTLSIAISFLVSIVVYSMMILLPIYLQSSRGMSAFETGLFLLPGSIIMAIISPISGKIYDKYGIKWIGVFGVITLVLSTAFYTNLSYSTGIVLMAFVYMVRSFGITFLYMPLMTAGLNALRPELHGHGAAMQNTLQAISGAIGTAIMTTIMTTQTNLFVANEVTKTGQENPTSTQLSEITSDGLLHGINISFVTATIFAVVGLVSMVALAFALDKKKKKLKTMLSNEGVY